MSSEFLSSYIGNAADDIRLYSKKLRQRATYEFASETSFYYRQRGSCHFFYTGEVNLFFDCMHKGAGSYLYFLINGEEADKRTADNDAFFDAINAGLWDCAKLMAVNSRTTCNFDYEYEDDFLYSYFLTYFFFLENHNDRTTSTQLLKQYEKILDGQTDSRFLLCTAFLENNNNDFLEHFEQFLSDRQQNIETMIEREVIGEEVWSWSRYFSNEGLALLKLAETLGFRLDNNYSQIPEILRTHPKVAFDVDLWKSLGAGEEPS